MTARRPPHRLTTTTAVAALLAATLLGACGSGPDPATTRSPASASDTPASPTPTPSPTPFNVYGHAQTGMFTGAAKEAKKLVYVPNTLADTVQVIDPATYEIVDRFAVGRQPHHVVPSWDLKTLWVNNTQGNSLTPIDPATGKPGTPVPVEDPYNLYFTPDGSAAVVMAERLRRIDILDPHTMALQRSLPVPCSGVNHADYDKDMNVFVASCEFSGQLLVIDKDFTKVITTIDLNTIVTPGATSPQEARHSGLPQAGIDQGASAMPQDVRLSPDGRYFLACDMLRNGVWVIDASTYEYVKFVETGRGTHSIYPSRDATRLFVSNRDEGTVVVLDAATLEKTAKWTIPGGGSPDMGGVTDDGRELWLSGRYNSEVYVFDTETGELTHRIKTDPGSHGLAVWPQPGRFSLGHTGNMR